MFLDPLTSFLSPQLPVIVRYILLPIYIALFLYIVAVLYSSRKGVSLEEEFHTTFFAVSLAVAFGWIIYFFLPSSIFLPFGDLTVKGVFGLFVLVVSIQYLVYLGSIFLSDEKTTIGLGISAGIVKSNLAVSVVAPMAAEEDDFSWTAASTIMLANTVLTARNFLIVLVAGIWLKLYSFPPKYFTIPMVVMFLVSGLIAFVLYRKGVGAEPIEFNPITLKWTSIFMALFLLMYYISREILERVPVLGFYLLSGAAGFLYGAAHIFIIVALFFAGHISLQVGMIGALLVTAGSILSDLPYSFFSGADELTKILLIAEIIPVILGMLMLIRYI